MKKRRRYLSSNKVFDIVNYTLLLLMAIIVLYPLYFVVIASVSDPNAIYAGEVVFLPKKISLDGYKMLIENNLIWSGYWNTIRYTVIGTLVNVTLTICAAYALSRKKLPGRKSLTLFIAFTMFFNGGLISTYLLVQKMGMINTMWAVILPGAVGPWNLIVAKSFFENTVPEELYEVACIDGCSELRAFIKVILPVSKAILAIMVLFYAVAHWNSYFNAMLYFTKDKLYPLQLVLRNLLIQTDMTAMSATGDATSLAQQQRIADQIKYGVIIISSVPVMALYPFVQKYFAQGVTLGAIKG